MTTASLGTCRLVRHDNCLKSGARRTGADASLLLSIFRNTVSLATRGTAPSPPGRNSRPHSSSSPSVSPLPFSLPSTQTHSLPLSSLSCRALNPGDSLPPRHHRDAQVCPPHARPLLACLPRLGAGGHLHALHLPRYQGRVRYRGGAEGSSCIVWTGVLDERWCVGFPPPHICISSHGAKGETDAVLTPFSYSISGLGGANGRLGARVLWWSASVEEGGRVGVLPACSPGKGDDHDWREWWVLESVQEGLDVRGTRTIDLAEGDRVGAHPSRARRIRMLACFRHAGPKEDDVGCALKTCMALKKKQTQARGGERKRKGRPRRRAVVV
jgi:hypothetical protein